MNHCKFCSRTFVRPVGLSIHLLSCSKNPDRDEDYIKSKRNRKGSTCSRWTREMREAHSKRMIKAVKDHPESYLGRWRKYSVEYKGEVYDSNWEVIARKYFDKHYITSSRKVKARLKYWFGDKLRTYVPDFYLPKLRIYVEVKGVITEKDLAKWEQFPDGKRLLVLTKYSIKRILNKSKLGLVRKIRDSTSRVLIDGQSQDLNLMSVKKITEKLTLPKLSTEERSRITKAALARSPKMKERKRVAKVRAQNRKRNLDKTKSGKRNSQYGSFWITDGSTNQKWFEHKGSFPKGFYRGRKI